MADAWYCIVFSMSSTMRLSLIWSCCHNIIILLSLVAVPRALVTSYHHANIMRNAISNCQQYCSALILSLKIICHETLLFFSQGHFMLWLWYITMWGLSTDHFTSKPTLFESKTKTEKKTSVKNTFIFKFCMVSNLRSTSNVYHSNEHYWTVKRNIFSVAKFTLIYRSMSAWSEMIFLCIPSRLQIELSNLNNISCFLILFCFVF